MTTVYIPSRARAAQVEKTIPRWRDAGADSITVVLDPKEKQASAYEMLDVDGVVYLSKSDMGLGYIRNFILEMSMMFEEAHIQADDDYWPVKGRVQSLEDAVLKDGRVGCGSAYSYHGLTLGNDILKMNVTIPAPAPGLCGNIFAINNELAIELGGFPKWATCLGEDHEMVRQSIKAGMPWYYTTKFQIAGLSRYTKGGHADLYGANSKREKEERLVHAKMHKRWGKFVSAPDKPYRSYWRKMLDEYCPGWNKRIPKRVRDVVKVNL